MSLVKGEGSSSRKGKEVVIDDPPKKGKEAPHSELNHFEKEEVSRSLDIECLPLIDLWYNTYSHFSVVPSDYLPPLSGCVWLSLEWHDLDIS